MKLPQILLWLSIIIASLIGVVAIITLVYIIYSFCSEILLETPSLEKLSLFGDSFGPINVLVSALAFAGLLYTIFQQRESLQLAKQELESSKKQMFKSSLQIKLEHFEKVIDELKYTREKKLHNNGPLTYSLTAINVQGRKIFEIFYEEKIIYFQGDYIPLKEFIKENLWGFTYQESEIAKTLEFYYKSLYSILTFITQSELTQQEKLYIVKTEISSRLSKYQLILLFIHAHDFIGNKFISYIEDYALFEDLEKERIFSLRLLPMDCKNWYKESAYKLSITS